MEMQNATVHVTNNFHIFITTSHNKTLQNLLAFCLSSFQEHSNLGSPWGSCFSTNPHRKGHRVGRSQRCKDASTCLAPWDTVNDKFKKCCHCQFCNPNFRSWFWENLKVACKVYRAKRHVSSWVTNMNPAGSFRWILLLMDSAKNKQRFSPQNDMNLPSTEERELTRSFEMQIVPDVAAVSFERSNSRSCEGSQLRRHGNFDWTTSSVDCGHSGNMGYLLDSGKPRSLSRFACLQQTLEDLPRKLDWKILQNLENRILAPLFWVASTLWLVMQLALCEATTTSCPLLLCLPWLGMKFVALLQHIWALNKRKLWSHTWRAGACSLASYLGNVASQHSFLNLKTCHFGIKKGYKHAKALSCAN